MSKLGSGMDHQVATHEFDPDRFEATIRRYCPRAISFTSKKAASLWRRVSSTRGIALGRQADRASGFPDEQMALVKNAGKVVGPANDSGLISDRGFDLRHQTIGTADGHGEIDTQFGEALCQFRCAAGGCMDHIQNAPLRVDVTGPAAACPR